MNLPMMFQMQRQAMERFQQQIALHTHVIDEKTGSRVGVFFGPFPHPAAAEHGFEPDMFQVVWRGDGFADPPKRRSRALFTSSMVPVQLQIYLPGNHIATSQLLRYLWGVDLMLPSLLD